MIRKLSLLSLAWLVWLSALAAAERTHTVTTDDYAGLAAVLQVAVSPDGGHVAYSDARWHPPTDDRKTDLWVVATDGKSAPRRLTSDRASDRAPKWSADGKTLYFLGNRKRVGEKTPYDGTTQVWCIARDGGEPRPVTRIEGGVAGYDLASRANVLAYATETTLTDSDPFNSMRSRFPKLEYSHGRRTVSEIWKLDLVTWRAEKWIAEGRYVREFVVTPDAARVAMVTAQDDTVLKSEGESRVDVWEDGQVKTPPTDVYRAKAHSPHAWLENLTWSPDGAKFAFCAIFDAYPAEVVIGTKRGGSWTTELMQRPAELHVRGSGSPLKWHPSGDVFLIAEARGRAVVVPSSTLETVAKQPLPDRVVYAFDFDSKGQVGVYVAGSSTGLPDLFVSDFKPGAEFRKLASINPQTESWKLPSVQHVTWKAPDGTEVGGVLELPPEYRTGTRLPLVIGLHGGPTTSTKAGLEFDAHNGRLYFATHGYAVLFPNYRGSTGYGDTFLGQLIGQENDIEVNDIIAGVQHLVQEGIADPERVGVMGWSNGGYLTNCLITKKNLPFKLKAASSGAGILDTAMEWGLNDEPAYPKVFKKGHPWETPELYRKTSPSWDLGNVKTATLIHVGGNDPRCPPGHSRMLYRALKEYVRVPTELVVYPGEPHTLSKYSHRKAKMDWDLAWFDNYLRGK